MSDSTVSYGHDTHTHIHRDTHDRLTVVLGGGTWFTAVLVQSLCLKCFFTDVGELMLAFLPMGPEWSPAGPPPLV